MKSLTIILPILISVALLTLIERKILGYSQIRKGPNIVGLYGILQPIADGVKLFLKESVLPNHINILIFSVSPILTFILAIIVWGFLSFESQEFLFEHNLSLFIILAINSVTVYTIIMAGWGSNSKYGFLGSIRATSQMISYEVSLGLILMNICLLSGSFNILDIVMMQKTLGCFFSPLLPISFIFFISIIAETNRAPFDLTEGESELVSGFNIEYPGFFFALFFLGEYTHIIFASYIFSIFFFSHTLLLNIFLKGLLFTIIIIWVRSSFPRFRYDNLMHLLWKNYLPISIVSILITFTIISLI